LNKRDPGFASKHTPISRQLKDAGYETAISGKWHLPGHAGEEAWGFDEYSLLGGYFRPFEGEITWDGLWFSWSKASHTFYDTAVIGKNPGLYPALYWHGAVVENGELLPSGPDTFAPDQNQAFALDFLRREREAPFFLYYPMVLPHDPWLGAPDPDNPGARTSAGFLPLITRLEYYLDELISTLKEEGLWDNTVIIFTADNATLGNGKGSCSELGVRVPLIVAGGPVNGRGQSDALVDFTDIYPTLLELAGIDASPTGDRPGLSFLPALIGEDHEGKEFIFSYLDMERTVRNREYMMDGSGGIWECSSDGNLLNYQALEEGAEAKAIREELQHVANAYPLPSPNEFSKERMQKADRRQAEPGHHWTTFRAWEAGEAWKENPRRFKE
jgi:arylsulfatase A-like enzyme